MCNREYLGGSCRIFSLLNSFVKRHCFYIRRNINAIMNKIFAIILLCFTFSVNAENTLTTKERVLENLFYSALLLDCFQTLDIKNHDDMYENNKILGRHPSDVKIVGYFLTSGYTHYLITSNISSEYRPYWQWAWIGAETATIIRNKRLHLSVNIKF